jgi:hypothetical protein
MATFAVLLSSHEIAHIVFGRGWGVVVAATAAVMWLVIRPWRFGLVPGHTRRQLRLMGIVALFGFVVVELIRYWKV